MTATHDRENVFSFLDRQFWRALSEQREKQRAAEREAKVLKAGPRLVSNTGRSEGVA